MTPPIVRAHCGHHTYSCQLMYRGEWGVEAQILRDGELMHGRRYDTRARAVEWADAERHALEQPLSPEDEALIDDVASAILRDVYGDKP